MSNRRPVTLLVTFALVAVVGFGLADLLDEHKGWNHPGQFVANIAWISMLLSVVGIVVTGVALLARSLRRSDVPR
ncbi:MAG: hypothetical protein M3P04_09245 [Actinomycetota bacterium]|nr:hypothetical protein [Actinomycetota bacterium]